MRRVSGESMAYRFNSMIFYFKSRTAAVRFVSEVRQNLLPDLQWTITTSQEKFGAYAATIATDESLDDTVTLYCLDDWLTM